MHKIVRHTLNFFYSFLDSNKVDILGSGEWKVGLINSRKWILLDINDFLKNCNYGSIEIYNFGEGIFQESHFSWAQAIGGIVSVLRRPRSFLLVCFFNLYEFK